MTMITGPAAPAAGSRVEDPPPPSTSAPIRVGLIGAGYIADWHARAMRSVSGASVVAVCDLDRSRAQALAGRHRIGRVHASIDEMIEAGGLDVVHVLLPPEHHHDAAMLAVKAGLHVLLEKPMAVEVGQCADLISAAERRGVRIGVGHNFLFSEPYERLRDDLAAGRLGRPAQITITWAKPLDVIRSGPFDMWMLREPGNILLEIGAHPVAHLLDLAGIGVELAHVRASHPVDLPGGRRFYRRWQVNADAGGSCVTLDLSFTPGFVEHSIHVRGSLGTATVDFERDTYVLRRHSPLGLDLDRYRMVADEAAVLRAQGRRGLVRYALSTLKLSRWGKPYGEGISRALRSFYGHLHDVPDPRTSAALGRDVVATCLEIARLARVERPRSTAVAPSPHRAGKPGILVLGATGFIGRELARQLVEAGHVVRLLVRNPGRLAEELRGSGLEIVRGDAGDEAALDRAMEGVSCVYHLARANAKTWDEYYRNDVQVTERIAEACLRHGVGRFVYTGTIDSYYAGSRSGTITEETPLDPRIGVRNKYARAKALSEEILWRKRREQALPVVIFRPGIVIGSGGNPMHWGVGMWAHDAVCQIWGRGDHPLPFVLVEDIARALVLALDAPDIEGESFNLVAAPSISAREYLGELRQATGAELGVFRTPPWRFYAADLAKAAVKQLIRHPDRGLPSYRDWETRTQRATYDCTKARRMLGWVPIDDRAELIHRGIHAPAAEFFA